MPGGVINLLPLMELSEHARKFLSAWLLRQSDLYMPEEPEDFFRRIAVSAAEKDKMIEPRSDQQAMEEKFTKLMTSGLFLPSFQWLHHFGRGKGDLLDTPMDRLGSGKLLRTSLADSEVFRMLDGEEGYVVDVPGSFIRIHDGKRPWRFQYRNEPNASGEVPSTSLWEAMSMQMRTVGYPILHFPESLRPEAQLNNPPGPMVRGVLNLARFVKERDGMSFLDWNLLVETIVQGTRFLDALVEIAEDQRGDGYIKSMRRIGLGMIGWGEALARLGIPYESSEALNEGRRLAKFVHTAMQEASAAMVAYRPAVEGAEVRIRGYAEPVRNLCRLYVLPEEELAFILGTTPGLEPLPGLAGRYVNFLDGESPVEVNKVLMGMLEKKGLVTESIMNQLLDTGRLFEDSGLEEDFLRLFKVEGQIDPVKVVEHQTTIQQYADDLVVARVVLPKGVEHELLDKCFRLALRLRGRALWVQPQDTRQKLRHFQQGLSSEG